MKFKKEGDWIFGTRKGKSSDEQFLAANKVRINVVIGRELTDGEKKDWESNGELEIPDESYGRK